jgi:tape measure domain-containing protein
MQLTRLFVRLDADAKGVKREMEQADRAIERFAGKVRGLGNALTIGLTTPLIAAAGFSVRAAADMDKLSRGLNALNGDARTTAAQMQRLQEVAKLPGLGFREAVQGAINLQAVGFSAERAERSLKAFGNAIALTGGGKAELDRVLNQLTQMSSAGRILTADLRPIIQTSPLVARALKEAFGTIDAQAIESLGLSFDQFYDRLVGQLEKLPEATGGAANSFENLGDAVLRARAAIGNQLLPVIAPIVNKIAALAEQASTAEGSTIRFGIALGAFAAVVGPTLIGITKLVQGFYALRAAGVAAGLVLGPTAAIAVGLGVIAALFVKNRLEAGVSAKAIDDFSASLRVMNVEAASTALSELTEQHRKLREQLAQTPTSTRRAMVTGGGPGGLVRTMVETANPEWTKLAAELETINGHIGVTQGRLEGLKAVSAEAGAGLAAGVGTAKSAMDLLQERVRLVTRAIDVMPRGTEAYNTALRMSVVLARELEGVLARQGDRVDETSVAAQSMLRDLTAKALDTVVPTVVTQINVQAAPILTRMSETVRQVAVRQFDANAAALREWSAQLAYEARYLAVDFARMRQQFQRPDMLWTGITQQFQGAAVSVLQPFTPLGIAATFLTGIFDGLRPLLEQLQEPIRLVGQLLGTALTPVLRILFPVLKAVAIAATVVAQIFYEIAGRILQAAGKFVEGIGRLIDKIPGISGRALISTGQAIHQSGSEFRGAAQELARGREEIRKLQFGAQDATEALHAMTSALSNMPTLFELNARRWQSGGTAAPPVPGGGGGGGAGGRPFIQAPIHIHNPPQGVDTERLRAQVAEGFVQVFRAAGLGGTDYALAMERAR